MNKKLIVCIASLMLLSACHGSHIDVGIPKPVQIPELPTELSERPKQLPQLTDPDIKAVNIDAAKTDIKYNNLAWQVNHLIDFYNCVKTSINEKKDLNECLN